MVTKQVENFARQSIFDALSGLFVQPEGEGVLERYRASLEAAAGLAAEIGADAAPFEAALKQPLPSEAEVSREFARLFLGVGESTTPLSESVWTSPEHLLCQDAQLACRKIYREAGLETAGLYGLPEDHLGLQLAFTAVLILKEKADEAARFFAEHPGRWLPSFTDAVRARGDAQFFRTVADVLDAVAAMEAQLREERA